MYKQKIFILALYFISTLSFAQSDKEHNYLAIQVIKDLSIAEINLLEKPTNNNLEAFLNGFYELDISTFDTLDFQNISFKLSEEHVSDWAKVSKTWEVTLSKKINIIKDFNDVPNVKDSRKAKTYISLSNPAFSEDGKFGIINLDIFSNYPVSTPESLIYIYKKEASKWIYVDKISSMLY